MHHGLFVLIPLPVILALVALVVLLIAVARVLAELCKPVQVRMPAPHPAEQMDAPACPETP